MGAKRKQNKKRKKKVSEGCDLRRLSSQILKFATVIELTE